MTRSYGPHDPRLKGVYEYDLITQTKPGWGFVHDMKPFFRLVSFIEYKLFIKGRPNQASHATSEPAPGADSSAHQG